LQQEREVTEPIVQGAVHRQIVRVTPVSRPEPEPIIPRNDSNLISHDPSPQAIPVIDLSDEETVSYNEYFDVYAPVEEPRLELTPETSNLHNSPIEVIDLEPPPPDNDGDDTINLEPLDPDAEYRHNIQQMFIVIDEYARNVFLNTCNN